jgi:hypothetical protein
MKYPIGIIGLACALSLAAAGAWAEDAAAVIEFSSGDDVIVIREGRRVASDDPIGLELFQGDQVQTGKGVFVEMRLSGGGSVVKLAENTTFVLERLSDGQTSLQLVYGRVRAKVERLSGADSFSVRSSQAIAGVRGTDFGLDVVASRSALAATTTNAYCFEGAVEVTAFVRSDAQIAESLEAIPQAFLIQAGEMLRIEGAKGGTEAIKSTVDTSIRDFWAENDYVLVVPAKASTAVTVPESSGQKRALYDEGYAQGLADAKASLGVASGVPKGFVSDEEVAAIRMAARRQAGGIIAGGLICVGGLALAIRGYVLTDSGDVEGGNDSFAAGAIISAMSLPFFTLALFSKP